MSDRQETAGNARLRQLVDAVLDGTATDEETHELDRRLQADADARQYFRSASDLHAALRWVHRAEEPAGERESGRRPHLHDAVEASIVSAENNQPHGAVGGLVTPTSLAPHHRDGRGRAARAKRTRFAKVAMLGGLLATLAGALVYWGVSRWDGARTGEAVVVAELRSDDGCTWSHAGQPIAVGSEFLAGQKLELIEGVARLLFRGGATVLVEAPTAIELLSATSLRLERGTVAVRASGPVKEFVVVSPDAAIADLGTSFGVHSDGQGTTQVEVFEGAVEVFPEGGPKRGRVLGLGAATRIGEERNEAAGAPSLEEERRFAELLRWLWQDIRVTAPDDAEPADSHVVEASFADGPVPGAVDTFYGAAPGRGWLTPWVAGGNPTGEIRRDDADFGVDNSFLHVAFERSRERAIAREYGPRRGFDPSQPHVISWRWRMEGNPEHFGGHFWDRVAFYGNPFFRRNSWPTNSWLIGVVGGDELVSKRGSSTEYLLKQKHLLVDGDDIREEPRQVFPMQWYFFDGRDESLAGAVFERRNMVASGMTFKPGVLYHFAVAVYPLEGRYDAAIRDDERTVVRTGLAFRSRSTEPANVLHFTTCVSDPDDDHGFSLDSVRIEPLEKMELKQQLEAETADATSHIR